MNFYNYYMNKEIQKGRVLIVEDDLLLSLLEERILIKLGYEVVGKAVSSEQALEMVKKYAPDIIIMDILLKSEVDGIETMHIIREFSDVPVIYISGNSDKQNIARAKKTNFIAFLQKPVSADQLVQPLKKAMSYNHGKTPEKALSQAG